MEIQWALVLFTVFSGAGAWLFAWSMVGWLAGRTSAPTRNECICSFVLLVVGGFMSVLHLKHVDRILEALNHPTSGIFVEAALIGVMCALVAVYFIMLLRGTSERARRAVGIITMVVGVIFSYACGSSYMMPGRPVWCTVFLPLAYAATAAAAGAAINMLMKTFAAASESREGGAGEGAQGDGPEAPASEASVPGAQASKQPEGDALAGGSPTAFAAFLAVIGSGLGIVFALAYAIACASGFAETGGAAFAWLFLMFAGLVLELVIAELVRRGRLGGYAPAVTAVVAGILAAGAMRVSMWVIGTPVLDFFLMSLD